MRWLLFLFLSALAVRAPIALRAQGTPPRHDFLFIVDTSISMADRKAAVASNIREILRSGFGGQAASEDTIDLWTFDSTNRLTRPPACLWDSRETNNIAAWGNNAIQNEKFHRGSHLAPVLADLPAYLKRTSACLVMVFTDPDEEIGNVEPAAEINRNTRRLRQSARRTKNPIIISMIAIDGKVIDWRAYAGGLIPALPRLPIRATPVVAPTAPLQPEPEAVIEKAPEPEKPAILNLPPGARILTSLTTASAAQEPAPSVGSAAVQPVIDERKIDPSVQIEPAIPASESRSSLPAPELSLKEIAPSVPGESEPAEPKDILRIPATQPLREVHHESVSSFSPIYLFVAAGGICVLGVGVLLMVERKKPAVRGSLISHSLSR